MFSVHGRHRLVLQLHFPITDLLVLSYIMRPLPVFAAVRTAEGFAVVGEIFNEQEIILIEVQVESAGVVAV